MSHSADVPLPEGCTARPLARADLDAAYHVYSSAQLEDSGVIALERADIEADWSRPSMDLARDTVGVLRGDRLVGAAEVARRGTRAEAAVHPHARGRGVGAWLAAWTEDRSREFGAVSMGQTVPRGSAGQRLLEGRGYVLGHTSWVLELPPGSEIADRPLPQGYSLRTASSEGDRAAAHEVIETAFGEWSDRTGETYDEWAAGTVRRPGFEPWNLRVVGHGDAVVGACFTVVDERACGFVDQVAVAREHRGRGLAQALLADGFRNAREHGAVTSELSTDSRTGALDLYRKVGMRVSATWVHLVRRHEDG
ncbi:GNAT family N-acetyltransferase [Phycicoccus sonneratiae]|uniref:GNAT family N-acetyltransferase n=1 Tax=Phycicoccus sonneratiae TaxID=2807628 RepID=A0ABS2CGI6_9MICO|nr:GNAT family N-acetyltransferase [Phycicoccus sonneraticus]MBM6398890.1 GNAT family N-acetyltransferase [Phycicoccus sonneraticus]